MPSSRPHHIPFVIAAVRRLKPQSILDVGTGFGKWGVLFREYTDIVASEHEIERYHKPGWRVRIDGIEGHEPYLTDLHRYVYDEVRVGDASALIESGNAYDVIFIGDVIEHFEKEEGRRVLQAASAKANKALILSTPATEKAQEAVCGNELEVHRSHWTPADFPRSGGWETVVCPGDIRVAIQLGVDEPRFSLKGLTENRPHWVRKARRALRDLTRRRRA